MNHFAKRLSKVTAEPLWLQQAREELLSGKSVEEYARAITMHANADDNPYSSSFVCWCLEVTGYKSTRAAASKSFISFGNRLAIPRMGCIVIHTGGVGFMCGVSREDLNCILLNAEGKVVMDKVPKATVLGFRWTNR